VIAVLAAALMLALAPAAHAQSPAGFGAHDEAAPIEITANTLEVRRNENVATFEGDVDAVQGELTLSAATLDVFYGDPDGGEAQASGTAAGAMGDIRRVVARGDVVVSSPREIARGAEGVYDVAARRIVLTGDVVLTRDDNVLRGNRLEIDLASGVSRLRAAGEEGRVRAIFSPSGDGS
jgi:lipopolysaccharide export system protein LptA